jgi:hypothetical protein
MGPKTAAAAGGSSGDGGDEPRGTEEIHKGLGEGLTLVVLARAASFVVSAGAEIAPCRLGLVDRSRQSVRNGHSATMPPRTRRPIDGLQGGYGMNRTFKAAVAALIFAVGFAGSVVATRWTTAATVTTTMPTPCAACCECCPTISAPGSKGRRTPRTPQVLL